MADSWAIGHYPPGKFPSLAFPAPPEGRQLSKAVIRPLIRDAEKEVLSEGKWVRRKETGTLSVSNQRSCGA